MQVMKTMEIMASLPPELVQQEVKVEEMPHYLIDKMGVPKSFKRSDAEKQQMQQQQAQMMQQMQEGGEGGV